MYSAGEWKREHLAMDQGEETYDLQLVRQDVLYQINEESYIFAPITNEAMKGDNYIYDITYNKGEKKVKN